MSVGGNVSADRSSPLSVPRRASFIVDTFSSPGACASEMAGGRQGRARFAGAGPAVRVRAGLGLGPPASVLHFPHASLGHYKQPSQKRGNQPSDFLWQACLF